MKARSGIKFGMQELADIRGQQASTRSTEALAKQRELKNLRRRARKSFGRDRDLLQFLVADFGETGQARWRVDPGLIEALNKPITDPGSLSNDYVKSLNIKGVRTTNELLRAAQRAADRSNKNPARMRIIESERARQVRREIAEGKAMRVATKAMNKVNTELTDLESKESLAEGELRAAQEALRSAGQISNKEKREAEISKAKQKQIKASAKLQGIKKSITSVERKKTKIIRGAQSIPEAPVSTNSAPSYDIIATEPPAGK